MRAIVVEQTGGPEQLEVRDLPDPEPRPGQVVVRVEAAGVNYLDTYHRTGLYPLSTPFTPGLEGAGMVRAVGEGVTRWSLGDRVAWPGQPSTYAELVAVDAERVVEVPAGLGADVAAASMLQGMTAHYLVNDTYPLGSGDRCLIHAGAGGVGLLLIQLAKEKGAEVFTTVSTAEKAEAAMSAGADHVINYAAESFRNAVVARVGPKALDVVYDGVGASTFEDGLELLRPRGTFVLFGQSSGVVPPFDLGRLNQLGSLYITRPSLFHHIAERADLERRAVELWEAITGGRLDVRIGARFPLAQAADAHRALEGRHTIGKVLLEP